MDTISAQIAALTAISDITALKHNYWRACDSKDVDGFRASFIVDGAVIDYGPLGAFDDVAPMVAVFERVALAKVDGRYAVLDMHTGGHADIEVTGPDSARGRWSLRFRQVNTVQRTETVSVGEYHDEYRLEGGEWRMSVCRYTQHWSMSRPIGDDVVLSEGVFAAG
jgi:hypothetical protein